MSGQASPWDLEEFHSLQGVNEAARGAAFLCRFVTADQKHPEGIVTNFPSILKDLYLGWPELRLSGDHVVSFGPLPRDCPSSQPHGPMRGLTDGTFNSASAHFFSVVLWARIFGAIAEVSNPLSLGDGEYSQTPGSSSSASSLSVSSSSFQLSSTGSLQQLFLAWSSRTLT